MTVEAFLIDNAVGPVLAQVGANQTGWIGNFLESLGVPYAHSIGSAITFVIAFALIYLAGKTLIRPVVDQMLTRRNLDEHARRPIKRLFDVLIVFAGIAVAFGLAGFGDFLQSLATIAAAATLAIGFALQDVIKNFVSGVFIYTDKPFRIGDWIEWDGYEGEVEDISLRVTRVRTFDNELLTVPNSQLTDGVIKNPVDGDWLRRKFVFGIGYDDDIDEASSIIVEEARNHDLILDEPAPSVRLTELGDSSIGLQARIWIDDPRRSDVVRVQSEYVKRVKERLDDAGIDIPYPQRVVHGSLDVEAGSDVSV
ncbi:MAG: mechanosensitive ion channel family protein [Halodesulfurarchaeum sp.]